MGSDSAFGEPNFSDPADEIATLREKLAASGAARREAEERCDALYRIAYGRVDPIVRRDEYEKTEEIISLVGDPPPRATSILSLVEGLVTQRDAAKERAFVAEKALASERAASESREREFNVANTERLRLHDEVENLAERIGQFEAAGFPNVATVLDRVEAERAAREAAEARVAELEQHRTKLDCRFVGRYAEMSGSHCPSGEPCQRCELERAREAAEAERDEAALLVSALRARIPSMAPVSEVTRLESSLSCAVEALREIDRRTGHFGEAPEPPEWMPMLSLIAWVGRTARVRVADQKEKEESRG